MSSNQTANRAPRSVILLGSTGSIGTQALDVIARNPQRFRVVGLAAGGANWALLARQAAQFQVPEVAVADEAVAAELAAALPAGVKVLAGTGAAAQLAGRPADVVLNAMTGAVGLEPTLAALTAGSVLALANKESLIIGGPLVKAAASPGQVVPVDSEHSALAQCLRAGERGEVRRLVLTASGGPFRGWPAAKLAGVSVEQALAHPTWAMGPVVTINSATMVNKGLEVIEAHLLFDIPFQAIDVVVHPQSMVHSMVEFADGSTIAQVSPPDMRLPIALGLAWPERVADAAPGCDWSAAASWTFEPLDDQAFPAVGLARRAGTAGGTAPAVFNAANEVAVAAFLAGGLPFNRITATVADVLGEHTVAPDGQLSVADVLEADSWARERAGQLLGATPGGNGE